MTSGDGPPLTVYGAPWCPHCKRVKKFLAAHRVPYQNIDIDEHPEAIDRLKELQAGGQIIPTVVYGDGSHDVNPSDEELAGRIGLTLEATRAAYGRRRPGPRQRRDPTVPCRGRVRVHRPPTQQRFPRRLGRA